VYTLPLAFHHDLPPPPDTDDKLEPQHDITHITHSAVHKRVQHFFFFKKKKGLMHRKKKTEETF
jgi:hypothetical protein